ncbi:YolD-like family protein [Paenibacillus sp. FSL P2-0121]|uniref:YolD-like family protein n=1 Tax=Paenibacillus sp. FSL P2-0121 TaxID=2921626 RepID=UPI0030D38771
MLSEISEVLAQSMEDHSPITITSFDELENKVVHGIVMRVDQQLGQIIFSHGGEVWEWIKLEDIVGAVYSEFSSAFEFKNPPYKGIFI